MASRALGAHRLALCLEQLREDHPVLLPVHFLFLRPFVLAKLLHLNDSEGRKGNERAAPARSLALEQDGRNGKTGLIFQRKERGHDSKPRSF